MRSASTRDFAKWVTTAGACACFIIWLASGVWMLSRIWTTSPGITTFMIVRGELYFARLTRFKEGDQPLSVDRNAMGAFRNFHWGFVFKHNADTTAVAVPLWAPTLLLALPAALVWRRDVLVRRRERAGLCPSCGYDRRCLAADSPCPECGAK